MSKHTPRPWQIDQGGAVHKDGRTIFSWPQLSGAAEEEIHANMRLGHAAPDLLEASPRAVEMLRIAADVIRNQKPCAHYKYDGADCDGYCIADDCESAAEDLSAAIAKAEGKDDAAC